MARFTILAVDDEASVLDLISKTFRSEYEVLCASSGREALEVMANHRIDLLITDQRMPEMRGIDLVERVRAIDPDMLVILLTAYTNPPDIIEAINRGQVYRFVTKPWELRDMIEIVRTALQQVELLRANRRLAEENQRRLAALELLNDVARGVSSAQTYAEFVDTLVRRVGDILSVDVVATLTRSDESGPASMMIRCLSPVSDAALEILQEALTTSYAELAGSRMSLNDLLLRVSGRTKRGDHAGRLGSLRVFQLETRGHAHGVIAIGCHESDAISQEDERILEIIATQTGEVLGALKNRLEQERHRTRSVLDRVEEGIVVTNSRGHVVLSNRSARRLLGLDSETQLLTRHFHRRLRLEPFEIVRSLELSGANPLHETVETENGTLVVDINPILDGGGGLESVVYRVRSSKESPKRDALLSFVSHELRTPITSMQGILDSLLDGSLGTLSDEQIRYLRLAREESTNLSTVLTDLIDESAASDGRIELNLELASLGDLVAQAAHRFEAALTRENIELDLKLPTSPVRGLCDPARLQQVLNNLLTHALQFTNSDGRVVVEVFADGEVGDSGGFSVWNSGAKLEGVEVEQIFERRAKTESEPGSGESGIGLSIARSIVEGHGGHIWAESEPNGVRFVVVLPLQGVFEREWGRGFHIGSVAEIKATARAPRVLVVEKSRSTAFALKGYLLSRGYAVDLASSADDAMQLAREAKPELVIVNTELEGLNGLELMDILRHDPDTHGLPILALCTPEMGLRVSRFGANAYLSRPFESSAFIASVQRLLSGAHEGRRVLIIDDDREFRAMCAKALGSLGFLIGEAHDGESALERAVAFRPDLILLDVDLPGRDGFRLFHELRAETATEHASVIFVSGRTSTEDKVRALRMGGDDYLTKPFEPVELGARAEMVLRRRENESASSPTTRLPGGIAIEREISRRIESGQPYSLCYLDLDNLKAFNDHYGYAKADGIIRQTGDLLREVLARCGSRSDFLGHIAGDDFVFITEPDRVDRLCAEVIDGFDRVIPLYYSRDDRGRGFIEAEDRYGKLRRFRIMSVSIAAVTDSGGQYASHSQIATVAAELKKRAKAIDGSCIVKDDVYRPTGS